MATKKHSNKKRGSSVTKRTQPPAITIDHPAAPRVLAAVNDYLQGMAEPKPRKSAPRLTLSESKMHELSGEAEQLGIMLRAVKRLSWLADDTDAEARDAAEVALESISILGTLRADALSRALGGVGMGNEAELLTRLTPGGGHAD